MRRNLIGHLLSLVRYEHVARTKVKLLRGRRGPTRTAERDQNLVPLRYLVERRPTHRRRAAGQTASHCSVATSSRSMAAL